MPHNSITVVTSLVMLAVPAVIAARAASIQIAVLSVSPVAKPCRVNGLSAAPCALAVLC